ncbi:MAG: hypothetical protein EBU01_09300 [Crocinitomicaceae bacterium]|nr:hypothetical protein [Crocinitomicaceae bacterium]
MVGNTIVEDDMRVLAGTGNISFGGTINGGYRLELGTLGAVSILGEVGGGAALTSFSITGETLSILSVTTTGEQFYDNTTVTLNGNYTTTNSSIKSNISCRIVIITNTKI